jgi:hypothetical protein
MEEPWQQREKVVERFEDAWQVQGFPEIDEFLADVEATASYRRG